MGINEMTSHKVAVLAGDGIGPEIMAEARKVLDAVSEKHGTQFEYTEALVGGAAIDAAGKALPEETLEVCKNSEAILFGAVGGPKWESLPPEQQPERAALLPLRKAFDLYVNIRPVKLFPALAEHSPLNADRVGGGFDILILRELTGGIYFGEKEITDDYGMDVMKYTRPEIERIAEFAFEAAKARGGKVTSVDKQNVLQTMVYWRRVVGEVREKHPEVEFNQLLVDNASMQLILNPKQFDVMLCPNMFGDILSDEAAGISGSLGMLPSASIGQGSFGLYEPAGGSAPDIAGKGIANPIAQILSAALMLRYSFNMEDAAKSVESAVEKVLEDGLRTGDIMGEGCEKVDTAGMGDAIADAVT